MIKLSLAVAVIFMYCLVPLRVSAQTGSILQKLDSLQKFDSNARITVGNIIHILGKEPFLYSYAFERIMLIYPYNESNDISIEIYTVYNHGPLLAKLDGDLCDPVDIYEVLSRYFTRLSYSFVPKVTDRQIQMNIQKLDSLQKFDTTARITVENVMTILGRLPVTYTCSPCNIGSTKITMTYPYNESNDIEVIVYTKPNQNSAESSLGNYLWKIVDIEEVKALYFSQLSFSLIPKVSDRRIQMNILYHRAMKLASTNRDSAKILADEYLYLLGLERGSPPKKK